MTFVPYEDDKIIEVRTQETSLTEKARPHFKFEWWIVEI